MKYDIILHNGRVIDPVNDVDGYVDIGIRDGKVVEVREGLDATEASDSFDVCGMLVVPGLVDMHVHASSWIGGHLGHKMMALAGVTTALDMAGPTESVLQLARDHGVGLNLACLHYVRPGHTIEDEDPGEDELQQLVKSCQSEGALGIKLLGGHYPITPEATERAVRVANAMGAYVAFHAGTSEEGSDIRGFREAVQIIGTGRAHLAHINSYCRGHVNGTIEETQEAIDILTRNPHISSESYLSGVNGTSSKCSDGVPESKITRDCLSLGGFAPTEEGFAEAIEAGWAQINVQAGGVNKLAVGQEGLNYWRERGTDGTVSFLVNPGESRYLLATARRDDGDFVVDAISTDGGGIPRNCTLELGLGLVRFGALSMDDFVIKTSSNPAGVLGLRDKGHLGPGADGDVTVIDYDTSSPYMTISNGQLIMFRGAVVGSGTRLVTTEAGRENVEKYGLQPLVVDLQKDSSFYA